LERDSPHLSAEKAFIIAIDRSRIGQGVKALAAFFFTLEASLAVEPLQPNFTVVM
jgi:hypothetical protein